MSHELRGVLPVFQTPYLDDETIDEATLAREFDWLFEHGAHGVTMAMVSEVLRLSSEERDELAQMTCRLVAGRGATVISVGAESTRSAVRHAKVAQDAGASGMMAIPPVSTAASEDQLKRYYEAILKATTIPLVVQDASGYVGRPMSIELQAGLRRTFGPRVMFKPEATPIGPRLTALLDATGGEAAVFEGTGGIALVDSFQRGVIGTMPGAEIVWALRALWDALTAGNWKHINAIAGPLAAIIHLQHSLDSFLAVEKYLLVKQGVFRNTLVRGPVGYTLDEGTRREVDRLFALLQEVCA